MQEASLTKMDDSNDLHMCGVCRDIFLNIEVFLGHKKKCVPPESNEDFLFSDQNINILENAVITSEDSGPMLDLTALSDGTIPLILQYNSEEVVSDKSPVQLFEEGVGDDQENQSSERNEADEENIIISVNDTNREDFAHLFAPQSSKKIRNKSCASLLNKDSDRCDEFFYGEREDILDPKDFTLERDLYKDTVEEINLSNPKKQKHVCSVCNFKTVYANDLKRHMRKHTGEKPFTCDICSKKFARQDKLKEHRRIHTGDKRFKCQLCEYMSTDSGALRRHLQIHTDERPYKCQMCSYTARTSSHMILHLRTHTGDSPFFCQLKSCGRTFKTSTDLKRHMKIHKLDKPYSSFKDDPEKISCKQFSNGRKLLNKQSFCFVCQDYLHKNMNNRRAFSRKRRGPRVRCKKEHQCPDCGAAFVRPDSLRSHMRLHNQGDLTLAICQVSHSSDEEEPEKDKVPTPSQQPGPSGVTDVMCIHCSGNLEDNLIALDQDGTIHSIVNTALL